ncbi:hypothetical protein LguiB_006223 [Lonicera macranthoides]
MSNLRKLVFDTRRLWTRDLFELWKFLGVLSYGWLEERSDSWINGFRVARIEVLVGLHALRVEKQLKAPSWNSLVRRNH